MNEVPRIRNPIPTNTRAPVIRPLSDELVSTTTLSPCKKTDERAQIKLLAKWWQSEARADSTWYRSGAIACVPEVARAFGWRNRLEAAADKPGERIDGSCCSLA